MTSVFSPGSTAPAAMAPLRAKWGWIVALGVVYLVAGFIALGSLVAATSASVFVVGAMMIVAGVFEVINAFQIKDWGRFIFSSSGSCSASSTSSRASSPWTIRS